jgi:hypothetical protein
LEQFFAEYRSALRHGLDELVDADARNGADAPSARLDELHSIACSRTRDDHLSSELRAYCDFVLPGRRVTAKQH